MQSMVISFDADGSIEHTLKDKFFKIEGRRKVERVSEIKFSEDLQKFYIRWIKGPLASYAGTKHRVDFAERYGLPYYNFVQHGGVHLIVFDTYEDAVEHEIAMINQMRLAGATFS